MKRLARFARVSSRLVGAALLAAAAAVAFAAEGEVAGSSPSTEMRGSYCGETRGLCYYAYAKRGRIYFAVRLRSGATNRIQICVQGPRGERECKPFRLPADLSFLRVVWDRHFRDDGAGTYQVQFRTPSDAGAPLSFRLGPATYVGLLESGGAGGYPFFYEVFGSSADYRADAVRPQQVWLGKYVQVIRLRWRSWGGERAFASGVAQTNTCARTCAGGPWVRVAGARVELSRLRRGRCDGRPASFYTYARVIWPRQLLSRIEQERPRYKSSSRSRISPVPLREVNDGPAMAPWLREVPPQERRLLCPAADREVGINHLDLLKQHAPHLKYDSQEDYRADSPATMAASANTTLRHERGTRWNRAPGLDYLGATYRACSDCSPADTADRLDVEPDGEDDMRGHYRSFLAEEGRRLSTCEGCPTPRIHNQAYGRAVFDDRRGIWLQYWLFYYYQPHIVGSPVHRGFGAHEGDWELVQVHLNEDLKPDQAAYAQHGGGERCSRWRRVEHEFGSDHPDVYVALSTHASYFGRRADRFTHRHYPQDAADGDGDRALPAVTEIATSRPRWMGWPGQWGHPPGPAGQGDGKWDAPGRWAEGLSDACD